MSSYDEFVHDPIRAEERVVGYLFDSRKEGNRERGVARSGVNGPFRWGSSSDRFYLSAEAVGRGGMSQRGGQAGRIDDRDAGEMKAVQMGK